MHFTVIQIIIMFLIGYVCLYALIDRVMKCIEPEGGEKVEFESYPRSIAYLVEMRKKVNREIEKRVK